MQEPQSPRINDFCIKLANVNGTGSASANGLLMKSLFRMGIPVTGKNYFPSNIQGLPTWYEIRVCAAGWKARLGRVDIMVAMNAQTYARDLAEVAPGGFLVYDSTWPRQKALARSDVTILGIPLARMCNERFDDVRARILMKNMAYVGALAALLAIDMDVVRKLIGEIFATKPQLVPSNMEAIELGYDYALANFACPLRLRVEALDATSGHIMIDGNTAAALGCLYAGATVGAWYPITPSTSMMDAFKALCRQHRVEEGTGRKRYAIVQAEDELAAIGMVLGAAWNGARAFTPTSGPGISLMSEFVGFGYFAEIPAVIFDVQRVGPSTGLPTRTQQGDILACAYASHGDTRHVVLFPADPEECFELSVAAFDLTERLQTPVFVLSDLDIGMNDWMCPEITWDDGYRPDRGKVLSAEELAALPGFQRYEDRDGDGICARSLPGTHSNGAYFTRGSGHTAAASYSEDAHEYQALVDRLARKFSTAAKLVPQPVVHPARKGRRRVRTGHGVVSLGSCDGAVREALDRLAGQGRFLDYLRVRAFPFNQAVRDFLEAHEQVFVVEQNRDAQLRTLLVAELDFPPQKLIPVLHYDGLPLDAGTIVDAIENAFARGAAA